MENKQEIKKFILPDNIRTPLLNYLGTKPYNEAAEAISALARLEEIKNTGPLINESVVEPTI